MIRAPIHFRSWDHYRERRMFVLGELRCPDDVPELILALGDPAASVRRMAASALGKHKARAAVQPLLALLQGETYPQVRRYAIVALGRIGDPAARPFLTELQGNPTEKDYNLRAAGVAVASIDTGREVRPIVLFK